MRTRARIAAESRVLLAHVVVASVGEGFVASPAAGKLSSRRDHRVNSSASARIMKMSIADTSAPTGCRAQVAVCSVMVLAGLTEATSSPMVAASKADGDLSLADEDRGNACRDAIFRGDVESVELEKEKPDEMHALNSISVDSRD